MEMPPLDPAILARRSEIVAALRAIVPGEGVIDDLDGMRPFECDALSAYRQMPLVVVLPETVAQVAAILRYCQDNKVKVVPRGGGTSLSGGSMPVGDAILLAGRRHPRQVATVADEDLEAEFVLEQLDLLRHAGLRGVQLLGGGRDVQARLGHRGEVSQLVQLHAVILAGKPVLMPDGSAGAAWAPLDWRPRIAVPSRPCPYAADSQTPSAARR